MEREGAAAAKEREIAEISDGQIVIEVQASPTEGTAAPAAGGGGHGHGAEVNSLDLQT